MNLSLPINEFKFYISSQLNHFFPDGNVVKSSDLGSSFDFTIERLEFCFDKTILDKYKKNNSTYFNHLYSDQYLMFLWFLSNSVWKLTSNIELSNKIFYLNKCLHSFDCMYNTELPDIFIISHGVGTILGKAKYNNFFVAMQGCTVGTDGNFDYPVFGKGVSLTSNSSVIGKCTIGDKVTISSRVSLYKQNIPSSSLVYNNISTGLLTIKNSESHFINKVFDLNNLSKY
jgi:serine O-acetyltransferase